MSFDPFAEFSDAPNPALIEPSDNEVVEINLLKTAEDQLFEAIERTYTKDKLSKQQNFNAVVLLHFIQNSQDRVRNEFRVKARIPELHNLIPVPLGANDMASIVMHPTFTGPISILNSAGDILLAGTRITVTFGNIDNFTEPKIISVRSRP